MLSPVLILQALVLLVMGATAEEYQELISIPVGRAPHAIEVHPETNMIYCANSGHPKSPDYDDVGDVSVIQGDTNQVLPLETIELKSEGCSGDNPSWPDCLPNGIAINTVTKKGYIANFNAHSVTVFDLNTNEILNTIVLPSGASQTKDVVVDPTTNTIFATHSGSFNTYVIDGNTDSVTKVINTGKSAKADINVDTRRLYVADNLGNLKVIDTDTLTLIETISLGGMPYGVAVDPISDRVYVTDQSLPRIFVLDGTTNSKLHEVTVGSFPYEVDVDVSTGRVYVANHGNGANYPDGNSVTIINSDGETVNQTVAVGTNPFAIAANPITGLVYVGNGGNTTVSVIGPVIEVPTNCEDSSSEESTSEDSSDQSSEESDVFSEEGGSNSNSRRHLRSSQ